MFDEMPYPEFKAITLAFFKSRLPDLDEISISLRIGRKVVGFVHIDADGDTVEFNSDDCHAALIGG